MFLHDHRPCTRWVVHPSGRFWRSRHTSLYWDALNLVPREDHGPVYPWEALDDALRYEVIVLTGEDVSKVLICYPRYEDERQRNSNTRECSHGSSSTSLLLLSRHGYCAPWHDAARQATVSLSAVPRRARAHISPGI